MQNAAAEIRAGLERVPGSPEFQTSKRAREFLRSTVERAFAGQIEALKERSLAVELFGRSPKPTLTKTAPFVSAPVRSAGGLQRKMRRTPAPAAGGASSCRSAAMFQSFLPWPPPRSLKQRETDPACSAGRCLRSSSQRLWWALSCSGCCHCIPGRQWSASGRRPKPPARSSFWSFRLCLRTHRFRSPKLLHWQRAGQDSSSSSPAGEFALPFRIRMHPRRAWPDRAPLYSWPPLSGNAAWVENAPVGIVLDGAEGRKTSLAASAEPARETAAGPQPEAVIYRSPAAPERPFVLILAGPSPRATQSAASLVLDSSSQSKLAGLLPRGWKSRRLAATLGLFHGDRTEVEVLSAQLW